MTERESETDNLRSIRSFSNGSLLWFPFFPFFPFFLFPPLTPLGCFFFLYHHELHLRMYAASPTALSLAVQLTISVQVDQRYLPRHPRSTPSQYGLGARSLYYLGVRSRRTRPTTLQSLSSKVDSRNRNLVKSRPIGILDCSPSLSSIYPDIPSFPSSRQLSLQPCRSKWLKNVSYEMLDISGWNT